MSPFLDLLWDTSIIYLFFITSKLAVGESKEPIKLVVSEIEQTSHHAGNDLTSKLLLSPIKYNKVNALENTEAYVQHSMEPSSGPM